MDNIIDIELTGRSTRRDQKLWQYDYGQMLMIAGKEFPKVTEVQFSLQRSGGHTLDRIGTFDNGVLSVQIPNELLQNKGATSDYTIYAFVYLSGDESGNTKYMIQLPVESRPEPTDPSEDPSIDPSIFKDAVNAVNASANRAEAAEKSARESVAKAKGYAESAGKSKEDVENARDNAITSIGTAKESALSNIASKTDESVQKIQSQTEESHNSIKQSIADATEKKTELDGAINNATDAKGNLDKAVQSAGNAKSELDASVEKASEAKTALDGSIQSAREQKTSLDATIEQANTVDTSLKEQIGSAEQIQANVEKIGKNTQAISSLKEDLAEVKDKKITKFYASNQGETHLVDSDSGKIVDMSIYGKSEQFTTTGKNLLPFPYTDKTKTENGVTFDVKDDGKIHIYGTATDTTYFNLSNNIEWGNESFSVKNERYILIGELYYNANNKILSLTVQKGETLDKILAPMVISINETNSTYEPYTGGIPSPNPDYPQEIKSVVNPIIKVRGKNLLRYPYVEGNVHRNGIVFTDNKDGSISVSGTATGASYYNFFKNIDGKCLKLASGTYKLVVKGRSKCNVVVNNGVTSVKNEGTITIKDGFNETYCYIMVQEGVTVDETIYPMIQFVSITDESYEPYKEQSIQLSITLNAIPVASGGNVTIDGQQYIADYVDVERWKLVRMVDTSKLDSTQSIVDKTEWLLAEPQEIALTTEEITAFKELATYYPTTNISVNSDQLDGYTVFNYQISMANGWNYVKQQLNDNRDYIYDMDTKTQDIDIQSAEAYVNSEYAVALTELEV